jgi:hypothetical protein
MPLKSASVGRTRGSFAYVTFVNVNDAEPASPASEPPSGTGQATTIALVAVPESPESVPESVVELESVPTADSLVVVSLVVESAGVDWSAVTDASNG